MGKSTGEQNDLPQTKASSSTNHINTKVKGRLKREGVDEKRFKSTDQPAVMCESYLDPDFKNILGTQKMIPQREDLQSSFSLIFPSLPVQHLSFFKAGHRNWNTFPQSHLCLL